MNSRTNLTIPLLPAGIDLRDLDAPQQISNSTQVLAQRIDRDIIPYAFIRFSNEAVTMQASLDSIKGFCSKGILAYHPHLPGIEDDGSLAIATKFVEQNPGFRLVKYPVPVIYHGSEFIAQNLYKGHVSRYWLLDCFYNYALLHLRQLARDNGEYDQAWLLKVDLDHIYDPQALRYAQELAYQRRLSFDSVLFSKYNVCFDHAELRAGLTPTTGLRRFLEKLGLSKKIPPQFKAYFLSHPQTAFDHWFVKLSKLDHFIFVNTYNPHGKNPLKNFSNYESAVFTDDCRHDLTTVLLHSYHLNREKVEAYSYGLDLSKLLANGTFNVSADLADYGQAGSDQAAKLKASAMVDKLATSPTVKSSSTFTETSTTSLLRGELKEYSSLTNVYQDLPVFDGLNAIDSQRPEIQQTLTSFWTAAHLQKIGTQLNYPYSHQRDTKRYLRYYADFDKLVNTPEYRIENWLNEFNQRRNSTTDPVEKAELDREAVILTTLFDQMTKEIENYSSHAGDTE